MIKKSMIIFSSLMILTVGCSNIEPTEIPTITSTRPTKTAVPPSATFAPPTNTVVPPTDIETTPPLTPVPPTDTIVPMVVSPGPNDVNVLIFVPNKYGANLFLNLEIFEQLGWHVTLAGVRGKKAGCPAFGILPDLTMDVQISEDINISQYDALAVMPSSKKSADPYSDLIESQAALNLIKAAVEQGLPVFAPCAGVRVLAAADVIAGRYVIGDEAFVNEYQSAGAIYVEGKPPPLIDDNIVTIRRGLYYYKENGEAVATILENSLLANGEGWIETSVTPETLSVDKKNTVWTKAYGGTSAEGAQSLQETSDGGFILSGYTFSYGAGNADVYLIKTDSDGHVEWSYAFGGPGWEYGTSVATAGDGGYIVAGYTTSFGAGGKDAFLLKVDSEGHTEWVRTFGGEGNDVGRSVVEAVGGGYLVAGYTDSYGEGESDIYVVKTDYDGNEEWSKTYGGEGPEMGWNVIRSIEDGYAIIGGTGTFGLGNRDVYLIKLSEEGDEIWFQTYGYGGRVEAYDWGNSITETRDGGYILLGDSNATDQLPPTEMMNFYVIKTDEQGNEIWTKSYGRGQMYDFGNDILETEDGGYMLAGTTKSGGGNNDFYVVKLANNGTKMWSRSFGGPETDWGSAVILTKDGDIVLAGQTKSYGSGSFDIWVVKIDPSTLE